jgi:hypothetical protein
MTQTQTSELLQRAWAAYLRIERGDSEQPSEKHSSVQTVNGLEYVALRNGQRVLAVYRVRRSTGALRRMRRWPFALGHYAPRLSNRSVAANQGATL